MTSKQETPILMMIALCLVVVGGIFTIFHPDPIFSVLYALGLFIAYLSCVSSLCNSLETSEKISCLRSPGSETK